MKDGYKEEYNEYLKQKIITAIDNISGYTKDEMLTLEFVYGAIRKFLPKDGGAA